MKLITSLETQQARIRPFRQEDQDHFIRFMTTVEVTDHLVLYEDSKSEQGAVDLLNYTIKAYNTEEPVYAYGIEALEGGHWVGACGLNPLNVEIVEVFYAVMPEYWGKGIGTEVLQAITDHIFAHSDCKEIHAFIRQENEGSKGVATKVGYANVGLVQNSSFDEEVFLFSLERTRYEAEKK